MSDADLWSEIGIGVVIVTDEAIQRETRRVRAKQLHERSLREEQAR
jgi:hypothetical protein